MKLSVVERGVLEVDHDLVSRWELFGVLRVRGAHYFDKGAVAKAHGAHQLLTDLSDELLLCEVLPDLLRHELSFLLVGETEVLGNHLQVFLVDVLQVTELGPATDAAERHVAAIFARVVWLLRKLAHYLAQTNKVDPELRVEISVNS